MSRTSRTTSVGAVLAAAALVAATATSATGADGPRAPRLASIPPGATAVAVTEGGVEAPIDGHVHLASSISGTVHGPSGNALGAVVLAYQGGDVAGFGFADAGGHYEIDGLGGLTTTQYAVCVSGNSVVPSGATGYLGRCYQNASFDGTTVPAGAATVGVASGDHPTDIDITLPRAAAVTGSVRSGSGADLAHVLVAAHNRSTGKTYFGFTGSTGSYTIAGLPAAGKGYSVCFDPYPVTSGTGYRPRCYRNKAWSGGSSYPSTSTSVSVQSGHVHTGINQTLPRGGAVSGRVTDAGNGKGVGSAFVEVFSSRGRYLASASAGSTGRFRVVGLAAGTTDRVCVTATAVSRSLTYRGRCWKSVAWNGGRLPSGTTPVAIHSGSTHAGIDLRVTKQIFSLGSISGTVTEQSDDAVLDHADVTLFRGGSVAGQTTTDASGHYTFSQQRAGSGYAVCASGDVASGPTPPATGWAPRCHTDVAWNGLGLPAGATTFSLSAGQSRTGVGVGLRPGGRIDGTVLEFGGATPAGSVEVGVYTTGGRLVTTATSDPGDGGYSVPNLGPASYVVCFDGRSIVGSAGYLPQCYPDQVWDGD